MTKGRFLGANPKGGSTGVSRVLRRLAGKTDSDPLADTQVDPPGEPLQRAALKASVKSQVFASEPIAPTIGRYAILEVLGEGGMGTVFAVYDDKLHRRVALKLLKGGHTKEARTRMLREAQAMAKLSHPNVVPVFEVGEHGDQLFVVMEYIRGVTLVRWCHQDARTWREVLDKYIQAGRGLAAAHEKGLVHRDFKPQNAVVGDDGRVRVLDFGLAVRDGQTGVAVGPSGRPEEEALDTPLTATGTVMGTLLYMSPEQFRGDEVDHRSDQFSFCVALWGALYAKRPFAGKTGADLAAAIANGEIVDPGPTKVPAQLRSVLERGLQRRGAERWPDLSTLIGELDRVAVDPAKRRLGRGLAAGAVITGVAVVLGVPAARSWTHAQQIQACEDQAAAETEAAWNDAARARVRHGLMATGAAYAETTATATVGWLDAYAATWKETREEVCLRAEVQESLGAESTDRSLWCLENRANGLRALVQQLETADKRAAERSVIAAAGLARVETCGDTAALQQRPAPPVAGERAAVREVRGLMDKAGALAAISRSQEAVEVARDATTRAEALDRPSLHASALRALGSHLLDLRENEEAEAVLEEAYFVARSVGDLETASQAAVLLAWTVGVAQERHRDGIRWDRHARTAFAERGIGTDHPEAASCDYALGHIYLLTRDIDKARSLHENARAIQERAYGLEHPAVVSSVAALAQIAHVSGDRSRAKALFEQVLELQETALGPHHPAVGDALTNLGTVVSVMGNASEAQALQERAVQILEANFGDDHPEIANALNNLGNVHERAGDHAAAASLYERSLSIAVRSQGADSPAAATGMHNLGLARAELNDNASALQLYERAMAIWEKAYGADHPDIGRSLSVIAEIHLADGDFAKSVAMQERALRLLSGHTDAELYELRARFGLAQGLVAMGRERARALAEASKAADGYRRLGDGHAHKLAEVEAWLAEQHAN